MESILRVKNLRKEYDDFVLKDVTFSIPRGYIMGLIGPNGAGKTTIVKSILNLIRRDGGEISIFELDNILQEVTIKSRLGFVHEVPAFYDHLPLKRIASIFASFYERWNEDRFCSLAGQFRLPLEKKFKLLSRGTKMKFAIALALSHDAEFLIMDEPTSGLDPVFRSEFLEILSEFIQDDRRSVLLSTHITSDLERIADYVTFVRSGEIMFSSTRDELLESWGLVKGGRELLDNETRKLFRGIQIGEFGFEALTSDSLKARHRLGDRAVVTRASLEDIMFFMVKNQGQRRSGKKK
jgi:ABC-2 type transport system ATP-binding protein